MQDIDAQDDIEAVLAVLGWWKRSGRQGMESHCAGRIQPNASCHFDDRRGDIEPDDTFGTTRSRSECAHDANAATNIEHAQAWFGNPAQYLLERTYVWSKPRDSPTQPPIVSKRPIHELRHLARRTGNTEVIGVHAHIVIESGQMRMNPRTMP
jgi:hypothetical protein